MKNQINSMTEETAGKLIESFENSRIISEKAIDTLQETFKTLTKSAHLSLLEKRVQYKLKYLKANIFTRWYWKRKIDKIDKIETKYISFMEDPEIQKLLNK